MFFTCPDFSSQAVPVLLASELPRCLQRAAGWRVVRSSPSKEEGSSLSTSHQTGSSSNSQGVCLLAGRCLSRNKFSFLLWQNVQSLVSVFTRLCPQEFAAKNPHGCGRLSPLFRRMLCFSCSVVRIHRRGLQKAMGAVYGRTDNAVVVPLKSIRTYGALHRPAPVAVAGYEHCFLSGVIGQPLLSGTGPREVCVTQVTRPQARPTTGSTFLRS